MKSLSIFFFFLAVSIASAQPAHEIMKSRVQSFGGQFENNVSIYGQAVAEWKSHMARVDLDKKNGVPKDKAFQPFPPPTADPDIMSSVDADGKPNFKIIDDNPDAKVLAAKKAMLLSKISAAANDAISAILPPMGKRQLFVIRENDIRNADGVRAQAILASKSKVLSAVGLEKVDQSEIDSSRPPTDTAFLQARADERQRVDAVQRAAAQMMSDVEDLTAANIDGWTMPAFPN